MLTVSQQAAAASFFLWFLHDSVFEVFMLGSFFGGERSNVHILGPFDVPHVYPHFIDRISDINFKLQWGFEPQCI